MGEANLWKVCTITLLILLVFAIFTQGFSFRGITGGGVSDVVSEVQIEGKLDSLIQALLPEGSGSFSITGITEESGVYKVQFESILEGNKQDSVAYVTQDGRILFLQGIDLDASIEALYSGDVGGEEV